MANKRREASEGGKLRYVTTTLVVVLLALLAIVIRNAVSGRTYSTYRVLRQEKKADSVSRYEYADGCVVRYSADGAALINQDLETLWTVAFSMESPRIDVCRNRVLIYDRLGTKMLLFDRNGQIGSFETDLPILSARVSAKDTAAALLRDGEKVGLVYYGRDGQRIAAGESSMKNPGYPVALALSPDGKGMAVSYVATADGSAGTVVRFYSFSGSGQKKEDNMTGEFSFPGILAPQLEYMSNSECVIFREDGFTVVRGRDNPREVRTTALTREIASVFCDGSRIGFITDGEEGGQRYTMKIFRADGRELSSSGVDVLYDRVRVCGNEVIFSSASEFSVYGTDGKARFRGKLADGVISDAVRIGRNRILILTDQRMEVIALK